jgi:hypothetical protein
MGTFYLLAVGLAYLRVNISIEPYDALPSGIGDAAWRFHNVHEKFSLANKLVHRDMPLARARGVRDRALREHRRSSGPPPPPLFFEYKGQSDDLQSTTTRVHPEQPFALPARWVRPARVALSAFSRP